MLILQNDVLLRCGVAVLFMSCLYGYCFRVLVHESLYAPLLAKTSSSVTTLLILLGSLEVVRFALIQSCTYMYMYTQFCDWEYGRFSGIKFSNTYK